MEKKYIVVPGSVQSIEDGQIHILDYMTLVRLYDVPWTECIPIPDFGARHLSRFLGFKVLYPMRDGDYNINHAPVVAYNKEHGWHLNIPPYQDKVIRHDKNNR